MHRKEFLEILQMIEGETVMLVTKALNNNSSHLIATTKMNIKTEDDFLISFFGELVNGFFNDSSNFI